MKAIITMISLLFFSLSTPIDSPFTIENNQSKLSVTGTSSLHPWEIELQGMNCTADVEVNSSQFEINALVFEAEAESLKSEHGRLMDKKTYKALKSEEYPKIVFTLKTPKSIEIIGNSYSDVIKGELYMAGTKKDIDLTISGTVSNGSVSIEGEKSILMTTFDMEPPTALMGTIKTGNEVSIHYSIKLKSK